MDFQLQVENLGQPDEKAELTIRDDKGKMTHIPVEIENFDYMDSGRIRTVGGTLSALYTLHVEALG